MHTALVTGASRGLGLELTRQLTARKVTVFAAARAPQHSEGLQRLVLERPHRCIPLILDVTDPDALERAHREVASRVDALDLIVNCAGINAKGVPEAQRNVRLGALEPEGLLRMIEVNAVAPILVIQRFLDLLPAGGRVAHLSSWLGSIAGKTSGGNYGYCASKATLNMLGRTLAYDLLERGVFSAMINPGWVRTEMGGQNAPLSPEDSARGILEVIDGLDAARSGGFYDHDGRPRPF